MSAWSGDPIPVQYVKGSTPLLLEGANVFQYKQCRNCHSVGGVGGKRGPALDNIASKLTEDQLIRQVLQGGGNMPAFGSNLSPAEVTAVVKFLETLRGSDRPLSGDASRGVAEQGAAPKKTTVEQGSQY
jgi:ubiquinol-cytochrome c reductase cytochrome b subunit